MQAISLITNNSVTSASPIAVYTLRGGGLVRLLHIIMYMPHRFCFHNYSQLQCLQGPASSPPPPPDNAAGKHHSKHTQLQTAARRLQSRCAHFSVWRATAAAPTAAFNSRAAAQSTWGWGQGHAPGWLTPVSNAQPTAQGGNRHVPPSICLRFLYY